jgi:SAM-dependent methyltransferase
VRLAYEKGIKSFQINLDEQKLPFKECYFDVIFAGYVIEHLFDPDQFLDEVWRVLKHGGLFVLATPNLASFYNRIALLLGFQPFSTAVSLRYNIGHMIKFSLAPSYSDHIRVFTFRSLIELLKIHKFKIIKIIGSKIPSGSKPKMPDYVKLKFFIECLDSIIARFPPLSYAVIIVCSKTRNKIEKNAY